MQTALKGRRRKNGVVALEPVLKEPFTFNDLRAKNATDEGRFRSRTQSARAQRPENYADGLCEKASACTGRQKSRERVSD